MYNILNSSQPPFSDMLWHYERNLVNTKSDLVIIIYFDSFDGTERMFRVYVEFNLIRLLRIIFIPSKFCYFRPPDHVISMEWHANNYTIDEPTIYHTRDEHANNYITDEPTIYHTRGEDASLTITPSILFCLKSTGINFIRNSKKIINKNVPI